MRTLWKLLVSLSMPTMLFSQEAATPIRFSWVMEQLHVINRTDQTSKKDEIYLVVTRDQSPDGTTEYTLPANKTGYWEMHAGDRHSRRVVVRDVALAPGQEVKFSFAVMENDNATLNVKPFFKRAANAAGANPETAWAKPLLEGLGKIAGTNKDDLIGIQIVSVKNDGGRLVATVRYEVEAPTNIDRQQIVADGELAGTYRATFHRKNKWSFDLYTGILVEGKLVGAAP